MPESSPSVLMARLLALASERAPVVFRLLTEDEGFAELCEHHALACAALRRFEELSRVKPRCEVMEYRALIRDMERDIRAALEKADR